MRKLALFTFIVGVVLGDGTAPSGRVYAQEPDGPVHVARVRSERPEIAVLIRRASETSAAFRQLTATVDGTDGLIYVEYGKCGHGVRACLLLSVQVAGPFRMLRVKIDARRPDCHLMANIGHELQHAIEILSNPHVTSGASAFLFYERIAPSGLPDRDWFETRAAQDAGDQVGREACSAKNR